MIVINFFSSDSEWWIEYIQNGNVNKVFFNSCLEYKNFILNNNLQLTTDFC